MIKLNTIICGDNLQILQKMRGKVDLIYLDPPLATELELKGTRKSADRIDEALRMLQPRVVLMHELIKESGSLFCQCDWNTVAYFQVLLDEIFGRINLVAKIIWQRSKSVAAGKFIPHTYDVILFYGKTQKVKYFPQYMPYSESEPEVLYKYVEPETGKRYRLVNLTSPNMEQSKFAYEFLGITRTWRFSKDKMEEEFKKGKIIQGKPGAVPMLRQYMGEGRILGDIWSDLPVHSISKEMTGYPTQKPMALLERIVKISTQEGDLVLDPFCGSGTTLAVAEELGRKWIGIDISPTACQIASQRLSRQYQKENPDDILQFQDYRPLREIRDMPHYEFENWIIASLKIFLLENPKFATSKGLDLSSNLRVYSITKDIGFDMEFEGRDVSIPVMVKQKEKIEAREISGFAIQLNHYGRKKGLFIAFSFSKNALAEIQKKKLEGFDIIPIRAKELISERLDVQRTEQR